MDKSNVVFPAVLKALPSHVAGDQLDAAYTEIASVITVGRGIGLWGDMVLTLKSGDKIELRSVPKCAESPLTRSTTVQCAVIAVISQWLTCAWTGLCNSHESDTARSMVAATRTWRSTLLSGKQNFLLWCASQPTR